MINLAFNEALNLFEQVQRDMLLKEGDDELSNKVREMILSNRYWDVDNYTAFAESISKSTKHPGFLTPYTPEDFKKKNATTYLLKGFSIGYALMPMEDGNVDIVSVHNNEPEIHNIVDALLTNAKENGGTQLDHFDGVLSDFYSKNGFEEYDRLNWDDEYAPQNWDYERYGKPDVVLRRLPKKEEVLNEFKSLMERMDNKNNFINEVKKSTNNKLPLVPLNEANALHLINKHTEDGYVIVSPCKGYEFLGLNPDDPKDVEKKHFIDHKRIEELIKLVKKSDFSYTPVYGGFKEVNDDGTEEDVYEHSFLIYPYFKNGEKANFDDLRQFALSMCRLFDQDSVLIKEPNGNPEYVTGDNEVDMEFTGGTKFNDMTEPYFTDLYKNDNGEKSSRFIFKEAYINPKPQSYSERHIRYLNGEIFLS